MRSPTTAASSRNSADIISPAENLTNVSRVTTMLVRCTANGLGRVALTSTGERRKIAGAADPDANALRRRDRDSGEGEVSMMFNVFSIVRAKLWRAFLLALLLTAGAMFALPTPAPAAI